METPHVGQIAPDFTLPDQEGNTHQLSQYQGNWVILYFYPEDDTPGCTTEACTLKDNLPHFTNSNAVVIGVSTDSVASHKKFAKKYQLPFTLLADESKQVVEQYGVWDTQKPGNKTHSGTNRTTFIIDPNGVIRQIYRNVKPEHHAAEVVVGLKTLRDGS